MINDDSRIAVKPDSQVKHGQAISLDVQNVQP